MIVGILKKLQEKINLEYKSPEDFSGFNPGKRDIDIEHNNLCYEIHYDFDGYKKVSSQLYVFEKVNYQWVSKQADKMFSALLIMCFNHMLCERFDSIIEDMERERIEQESSVKEYEEMMETYRSLQLFR